MRLNQRLSQVNKRKMTKICVESEESCYCYRYLIGLDQIKLWLKRKQLTKYLHSELPCGFVWFLYTINLQSLVEIWRQREAMFVFAATLVNTFLLKSSLSTISNRRQPRVLALIGTIVGHANQAKICLCKISHWLSWCQRATLSHTKPSIGTRSLKLEHVQMISLEENHIIVPNLNS